jgi:hypothetical protein
VRVLSEIDRHKRLLRMLEYPAHRSVGSFLHRGVDFFFIGILVDFRNQIDYRNI